MAGIWTNQIQSASTYAGLPAGCPNGTTGRVTADGSLWVYNAVTGLWLHPDVQPTALVDDYVGSAKPDVAVTGHPAWTQTNAYYYGGSYYNGHGGTATTTANTPGAGELEIKDPDGSSWELWRYTDAVNIVSTKNIAFIVRLKFTASNTAGRSGYRFLTMVNTTANYAIGAAYCAYGLDSVYNMYLFNNSNGLPFASGSQSPNNAPTNTVYRNYYLYYRKDTKNWHFGELGTRGDIQAMNEALFDSTYTINNTIQFGAFSGANTVTAVTSGWKLFNF